MKIYPPLLCYCIVHRAILKKTFINQETGTVRLGAFLRRPPHPQTSEPRDAQGLSVNLTQEQSQKACPNNYGIGTLHVGRIRDIETPVRLDVVQNQEDHANIVNLPAAGENKFLAEFLATELAEQCRLCR